MCMGKVSGTLPYPYNMEGFIEAEKSLPDLYPERVGVWQRDVGDEGRGYAKTRKNKEDDDQMDVQCKQ